MKELERADRCLFQRRGQESVVGAINFSLSSIEFEQGIMENRMTRYWRPNGLNWSFFSNAAVDKLDDESLEEFAVRKRNALIGEMHENPVAEAYDASIVHDLDLYASSPKLTGYAGAEQVSIHDTDGRGIVAGRI